MYSWHFSLVAYYVHHYHLGYQQPQFVLSSPVCARTWISRWTQSVLVLCCCAMAAGHSSSIASNSIPTLPCAPPSQVFPDSMGVPVALASALTPLRISSQAVTEPTRTSACPCTSVFKNWRCPGTPCRGLAEGEVDSACASPLPGHVGCAMDSACGVCDGLSMWGVRWTQAFSMGCYSAALMHCTEARLLLSCPGATLVQHWSSPWAGAGEGGRGSDAMPAAGLCPLCHVAHVAEDAMRCQHQEETAQSSAPASPALMSPHALSALSCELPRTGQWEPGPMLCAV